MSTFRLSSRAARLLRDTAIFLLGMIILRAGVQFAHRHFTFDMPRWWPLSIFNPRTPTSGEIVLAVFVALGFLAAVRRLEQTRYRSFAEAAVFGTLLILGSNAIQGKVHGFIQPITGGTIQYYHDARQHPEPPLQFLKDYSQIQPALGDHGRTHPPGAVLLFRALIRLTGDIPIVISALLASTAALASAYFFALLLSVMIPKVAGSQGALLLLLLPALQIYYCAALDAVIAALLLGSVALYALPPRAGRTAGSALCLVSVSFLTFGFVWVLPLLLMAEVNRWEGKRSLLRLTGLFGALAAFYLFLYVYAGFSYPDSLRIAAHLENPQGFRLLAEPLSYFFTRLEDIAEIAIFTGPVLLSLTLQNLKAFRRDYAPAWRLYLTALATLGALFLTGAYRTGETARACLFIFPYLLLPVLTSAIMDNQKRLWLYSVVFGQALLMQLLGRYFW